MFFKPRTEAYDEGPIFCPADRWASLGISGWETKPLVIDATLAAAFSDPTIPANCNLIQTLSASLTVCNAVYLSPNFWPTNYDAALATFRSFYHGLRYWVAVPLLYDAEAFNVAMHVRKGDITPTPLAYYPKVLRSVLTLLVGLIDELNIVVYVFSEEPTWVEEELTAVLQEFGNVQLRVDTTSQSMEFAFAHWMAAEVLITCDSSISWIANYVADGGEGGFPIAVASPNFREEVGFRGWAEGNVGVDEEGRIIRHEEKVRLRAVQWLLKKRENS